MKQTDKQNVDVLWLTRQLWAIGWHLNRSHLISWSLFSSTTVDGTLETTICMSSAFTTETCPAAPREIQTEEDKERHSYGAIFQKPFCWSQEEKQSSRLGLSPVLLWQSHKGTLILPPNDIGPFFYSLVESWTGFTSGCPGASAKKRTAMQNNPRAKQNTWGSFITSRKIVAPQRPSSVRVNGAVWVTKLGDKIASTLPQTSAEWPL